MQAVLISLTLILLTASTSLAQGLGRLFPEPITWPTLRERLDVVAPSDAQLVQIAEEHDRYLQAFEILSDGRIAAYLDESGGFGALSQSDPEVAERFVAQAGGIRREIAALDDVLFSAVGQMLGDTQQSGLERIQQRRTRDRMMIRSAGLIIPVSVPRMELRDAIEWSNLDEPSRTAVEFMLTDWENARTDLLRRWVQASDRTESELMKVVAELNARQQNFSVESPPTQDEIAALISTFQNAQQNALEEIQPRVDALQRQSVKGMNALADVLPQESRLKTLMKVARSAVPPSAVAAAVRGATRQNHDDMNLVEIRTIEEAWESDATPLVIDFVEAQWKDDAATREVRMSAEGEDGNLTFDLPDRNYSREVREQWKARHDQTIDAIASLVPDMDVDQLVQAGSNKEDAQTPSQNIETNTTVVVTSSSGSDGEGTEGTVIVGTSVSSDEGNPMDRLSVLKTIPAITHDTVEAIERDLKLNDSQRATLETLHATHESSRLAMETERAAERQEWEAEAQAKMESGGEQNQTSMMEMAMIMMTPISREGLEELDDAFYDGVESLASDPALARPWRLSRMRRLAVDGGGMMSASIDMMGVPDDRWKVDLLELIQSIDLDEDEYAIARETIAEWHESATAALIALRDQRDALESSMQEMVSAAQNGGSMNIDMEAAMKVQQLQQELQNDRSELSAINAELVSELESALRHPVQVRRAWMQMAFPGLATKDPFLERFARASNVPDLSDEQRLAIATLRAEHEDAWWTETSEAVSAITSNTEVPANDQEAFFQAQRVRQKADRHTFARREAGLKRLEQLRNVLNEQQLARTEGLPDPPEQTRVAFPF